MEKRRFFFFLLLLSGLLFPLHAQWDTPIGLDWTVKNSSNPSFTGMNKNVNVAALYRHPSNEIINAPRQLLLTAEMPIEFLNRRHGIGVVSLRESVGELHNSQLAIQYSHQTKVASGSFHTGIQVGVHDLRFDAGSKHLNNSAPSPSMMMVHKTNKQLVDLSAGISWNGESSFVGISAMHLNQPHFHTFTDTLLVDLQTDSTRSFIPRSYNFMAGYNIVRFQSLEIQPMVWVQTDLHTLQVQTTLRLAYNKKYAAGISWRVNDGYTFFAATTLHHIALGYAYVQYPSGTEYNSKGTHEISLQYHIPLHFLKPKRAPHQSIRLL